MKILWFVNSPFPEVVEYLGLKGNVMGSWMPALKQALVNKVDFNGDGNNQLGIACSLPNILKYQKLTIGEITYFCLPKSRLSEYLQSYEKEISYCLRAVEEFDPDIINVHGTEEFYGLLTERIHKPVVITLQGILSAITKMYFGGTRGKELFRSPEVIKHFLMMCRKARTEGKIFRLNQSFIGRTAWDKCQVMTLKSGEYKYYHCHELMREEFYQKMWTIKNARPGTIACISSCYAYKGIDCLIEAVSYVKKRIPEVILSIYGEFPPKGHGAFLRRKAIRLGLSDNIQFCGFKGSRYLAEELTRVRAFVIASHIENSSNSLQEAMLAGTPAVVSYTGGLPSLAEHEKTCLMFPKGDATVMADCLYKVLTNDTLARRLSEAEKKRAQEVNNPTKIVGKLFHIYQAVIDSFSEKKLNE